MAGTFMFTFLRNCQTFSKVVVTVYITYQQCMKAQLSYLHKHLSWSVLLILAIVKICVIVSYCGFNLNFLMSNNVEHLFM